MNKVFSKSNLKAIREYKCITIKALFDSQGSLTKLETLKMEVRI